jgi:hypothetical protein
VLAGGELRLFENSGTAIKNLIGELVDDYILS